MVATRPVPASGPIVKEGGDFSPNESLKYDLFPGEDASSQKYDLFPKESYPLFTKDYTRDRALMYSNALGEESPGVDVIQGSLSRGQDASWSYRVALSEQRRQTQLRGQILQELLNNRDFSQKPTRDEVNLVYGLSSEPPLEKEFPVEKKFSEQYTDSVLSVIGLSRVDKSWDEIHADEVEDRIKNSEIRQKVVSKLQNEYDNSSWAGYIPQVALSLIPGWQNLQLRNSVGQSHGAFSQGGTMQAIMARINRLSGKELEDEITSTYRYLYKYNRTLIPDFLQGVRVGGLTDFDATLMSVSDVVDAATLGMSKGVTSAAKGVAGATKEAAKSAGKIGGSILKGRQKSLLLERPVDDLAGQMADQGLVEASTKTKIYQSIQEGDASLGMVSMELKAAKKGDLLQNAGRDITDLLNTDVNAVALARGSQAMKKVLENDADLLLRFTRREFSDEDTMKLFNATMEELSSRLGKTGDNVVASDAIYDPVTGLPSAVIQIGRKDGMNFKNTFAAEMYAGRFLKDVTDDYQIIENTLDGTARIQITRPLQAGEDIMKTIVGKETPTGFLQSYLGKWTVGANKLISGTEHSNRGAWVYLQEGMTKIFNESYKSIRDLPKADKKVMEDILYKNNLDSVWFTPEEFSEAFFKRTNRLPSQQAKTAYSDYVYAHDMDFYFSNRLSVQQKVGKGINEYHIPMMKGDKASEPIVFEGKMVDRLPWENARKAPFKITVIDRGNVTQSIYSNTVVRDGAKQYNDLIENGYKVIHDSHGRFYLSKEFKQNLPKGDIDYKPGGHGILNDKHFVKVPTLEEFGNGFLRQGDDVALFSVRTAKEAREISDTVNEAKRLFLSQSPEYDSFFDNRLSNFFSKESFEKLLTGPLSGRVSAMAVKSGQRTSDIPGWKEGIKNLVDAKDNPYDFTRSLNVRFMGERSEIPLSTVKSENGVLVKDSRDLYIRPYEALDATLRNTIQSATVQRSFNESSLRWAREFQDIMDVPLNELLSDINHYIRNPVYKKGADPAIKAASDNVRSSLIRLRGAGSEEERTIRKIKESLVEMVSERLSADAGYFLDERILSNIPNVVNLAKGAAFHSKLGLFNPKQLFLQGSEMLKTAAISPIATASVIKDFTFFQMAHLTRNSKALSGIAKMASETAGTNPEEFLAMISAYRKSGFNIIGGDLSTMAGLSAQTSVISGVMKKTLNMGVTPFKTGEKGSRSLAYAVAFREQSAKKSFKEFTQQDYDTILQRAGDLTTNMGRHNNAVWQDGYLSLVTQFWGYAARNVEAIMLNGGLTNAERVRLMTAYTALFGFAQPLSFAAPVNDWKETMKQYVLEYGYDLSDPIIHGLLEGGLSSLFRSVGVDVSFGGYGQGSIDIVGAVSGDKSMLEVMGGAGLSISGQMIGAGYKGIAGVYEGLVSGSPQVSKDALLEASKEISSSLNIQRAIQGFYYNQWTTKDGRVISEDISSGSALLSGLLGGAPVSVENHYSQREFLSGERQRKSKSMKEAEGLFRKAMDAGIRNDDASYKYYMTKFQAWGVLNMTPVEFARYSLSLYKKEPANKQTLEMMNNYLIKQKNLNNLIETRKQSDGGI